MAFPSHIQKVRVWWEIINLEDELEFIFKRSMAEYQQAKIAVKYAKILNNRFDDRQILYFYLNPYRKARGLAPVNIRRRGMIYRPLSIKTA